MDLSVLHVQVGLDDLADCAAEFLPLGYVVVKCFFLIASTRHIPLLRWNFQRIRALIIDIRPRL